MASHSESPIPARLQSQLLALDADMRDLVEEFIGELPTRLAELHAARRVLDWPRMQSIAHGMKGAGGSYGYPLLSHAFASLETAFRERRDDNFGACVQRIESILAAARAGFESAPREGRLPTAGVDAR
jgi:HPt (histidine-containing phosphotransfer) domain-containing protein